MQASNSKQSSCLSLLRTVITEMRSGPVHSFSLLLSHSFSVYDVCMFVYVSVQMAPMNVEVREQPWVSVVTSILRPVLLFTCASYARLVVPEVPEVILRLLPSHCNKTGIADVHTGSGVMKVLGIQTQVLILPW